MPLDMESGMSSTQLDTKTVVATDVPAPTTKLTIIQARRGWRVLDLRELYEYRDLFSYLVFRSYKVLYAQSAIGVGWALIQPLFSMIVFTVIFGKLAKVSSDGVPYAIFSFTAMVPWTYFSNALTDSTNSLIASANMISKVYFPRLLLPLAAVVSKLVSFGIAMLLLGVLMAAFRIVPNWGVLALPLLILLMMLTSAGMGEWLTALAIQYRDVKHGMNFVVQLLMYLSPVVYPTTLIPRKYQLLYALNPMVAVIEGFRSALLGTRPMPWDFIAIGAITATLIFVSGVFYFQRREHLFADVA
jgi:lipopolysaccharide transport system permease protein